MTKFQRSPDSIKNLIKPVKFRTVETGPYKMLYFDKFQFSKQQL